MDRDKFGFDNTPKYLNKLIPNNKNIDLITQIYYVLVPNDDLAELTDTSVSLEIRYCIWIICKSYLSVGFKEYTLNAIVKSQ